MKEKITAEKANEIGEELRKTRYKSNGKIAFAYVFDKYKRLFVNYDQFLKLMKICSLFFSCQENVEEIREKTEYIFV